MTPDERESAAGAYAETTSWGSAMYRMVRVLQAHGHYAAALDIFENFIEMEYCWRERRMRGLESEEREDRAAFDRLSDRGYEVLRNELTAQIRKMT
jgi:hypothetical protein